MLKKLEKIQVPKSIRKDKYEKSIQNKSYSFLNLKQLLGAADYSKAGDRNLGIASRSELEREIARDILSRCTLLHLYESPLTDLNSAVDSVMRVNYDIDLEAFQSLSHLQLGELKDRLLKNDGRELTNIPGALTGVMAAALAKICDVHELIYISKKFNHPTKARTLLGESGRLSSRLQPNHPTDDIRGVSFLVYTGLSMGSGDALIGINPAIDTVENVTKLLITLDKLRRETQAPTQICVLSHIKTQLAALERGAPVEILFQSLAGNEKTNVEEFDITVELLDLGYQTIKSRGALRDTATQFMYFETGQGSEFSYGKANGIDMATLEGLCYGLARRYDPFMVNNVTGFIGPETHLNDSEMLLSNLQDHFMGKLLGLPMGMAPCFTLHSHITLEGQQMATQMLSAAGANYYMDVCLNTDRMLAYFDTSAHDNQTLREIYDRLPSEEFLQWAIDKNIFHYETDTKKIRRGPNWGNPRIFCRSESELQDLRLATPSIYGLESSGPRPKNTLSRELRTDQAIGRQAIRRELDLEKIGRVTRFRKLKTQASCKEDHLNSPLPGSQIDAELASTLRTEDYPLQIILSDGLSADAIHHNIESLFPVLEDGLKAKGIPFGMPWVAQYGRVKLVEPLAKLLKPRLVLSLIGERPGGNAEAACSLSAYFAYFLKDPNEQQLAASFSRSPSIEFEYTVISNIYRGGLPPEEAASVIVAKIEEILEFRAAGNRLEKLLTKFCRVSRDRIYPEGL